jgi:Holliday junction resolvase RusA-like endonuclease
MSGTNALAFIVPGSPVAKARPRAAVVNGRARIYTPRKTAEYEAAVAWRARSVMRGRRKLAGPISVSLDFLMPIPASWPKKRRAAALQGGVPHVGLPDLDNLVKSVVDGMNGIVFEDDSAITRVIASKTYSPLDDDGACRVQVEQIEITG